MTSNDYVFGEDVFSKGIYIAIALTGDCNVVKHLYVYLIFSL